MKRIMGAFNEKTRPRAFQVNGALNQFGAIGSVEEKSLTTPDHVLTGGPLEMKVDRKNMGVRRKQMITLSFGQEKPHPRFKMMCRGSGGHSCAPLPQIPNPVAGCAVVDQLSRSGLHGMVIDPLELGSQASLFVQGKLRKPGHKHRKIIVIYSKR